VEGYVYVRAEYPLAVRHLQIAIEQAERWFSWKDILGSSLILTLESAGEEEHLFVENLHSYALSRGKLENRAKHIHTVEAACGKGLQPQ